MKQIYFILLFLAIAVGANAQTNDIKQEVDKVKKESELKRSEMKAEFEAFRNRKNAEFQHFRDSVNAEYARFLAEKWEEQQLMRHEMGFKPMPQPPVYVPEPIPTPVKKDNPLPVPDDNKARAPIRPQPEPTPEPILKPQRDNYLKSEFFGTTIKVGKLEWNVSPLRDVSEKSIAAQWKSLSNLNLTTILSDIERLQEELQLDDWGMYQLTYNLGPVYNPSIKNNDRVVFSIFLLNQLGYKARIGRSGTMLYPLLAIGNDVKNTMYFKTDNGDNYYVINPTRQNLSSVECCSMDFKGSDRRIDMTVKSFPAIGKTYDTQLLTFNGKNYIIDYNPMLCNYLSTYPCVDFSIYGKSPVDQRTLNSLQEQLKSDLRGKSTVDAVNFLLHFVQNAFQYKTDQDNYGYEKWNFAEETLISEYSDCDDRAVLFAQLVKQLLHLDVVLIYYPGIHLATAVKFGTLTIDGTYVTYKGHRYMICDPTYINANIGMDMPQLKGHKVEIIPII